MEVVEMPDVPSEFLEMRFRKSEVFVNRNYSLSGEMYRLFFALDENKTMSQLASQQQMAHAVMLESIVKLWNLELIEPIGVDHLQIDSNFLQLVKINLFYILGNKDIAYSCVDAVLQDVGVSQDQLPASKGSAVVSAVSQKISNSKIRKNFQDFMETLLLLRAKKKPLWASVRTVKPSDIRDGSRGKTRQFIDRIIEMRSGGNPILVKDIKTKLMLKGINPDAYSESSLDNPKMLDKLRALAASMGVDLENKESSKGSANGSRGQIRRILLGIIEKRSKGNPFIAKSIRAKLFMKGINVDKFGPDTPDDPKMLEKVKKLAMDM